MDTRKKLITLLSNHEGGYISGQRLSEELQISRSAIWKHMKALEKDGFEIEAVSRKGYRIVSAPNEMSSSSIQWGLETEWLGKKVIFEKQTDSTQKIAHMLANEGASHGTVVVADEQLQGRGRLSRPWYSKKGKGIWMSIILRPDMEPYRAPQLTLLTAVATSNMLKQTAKIPVQIKWPNDIYIHDRKLAGILTEMQGEQDRIEYVIIGIGMNINHSHADFPEDVENKATSLKIESEKEWKREPFIQALLKELEQLYALYMKEGFEPIKEMWEQSAYKLGEIITIHTSQHQWVGRLIGLHHDGALIVEDKDKKTHRIYSGEIDWKKDGAHNAK